MAAAFAAAGGAAVEAADVGERVTVRVTKARTHVATRVVAVRGPERDGAVLFSRKVVSRDYAYPRLSPGLLPTSVAVAYDYSYVPDYGFAYRLAPPVPPGATCVVAPQLLYNSGGVFIGYGEGLRCY